MVTLNDFAFTLNEYTRLLSLFKSELAALPEGSLIYKKRNERYIFYRLTRVNGKSVQQSLGKHNDPGGIIANQLKYKRALLISIKILEANVACLKAVVSGTRITNHINFQDFDFFIVDELLPKPFLLDGWSFLSHAFNRGIVTEQPLTNYSDSYDSKSVADWLNKNPYPKQKSDFMKYHEENLKHNTGLGFKVRSKSEAMICLTLSTSVVPFKHEEPLRLCYKAGYESPTGYLDNAIAAYANESDTAGRLNDSCKFYFPDFTILMPNGKTVFWEHLGRMDKDSYRTDFLDKLNIYARNGLYPGKNLFFTYEDSEKPLDVDTIQATIKHIFKRAG